MTEQSTTASQPPPQTAPAADAASAGKVPIGVTTQAGYGVALAGLLGAALAYLTGDHSQAQLGSIVSGSIGLLSLLVTQIGRYVQANTQIPADRRLLDAYRGAAGAVHVIERADPQASDQLAVLVRAIVDERLKGLPAGPRQAVRDLEQDLLPSEQEESAIQPPPGALGGGAAGSTPLGAGPVVGARADGA